MTALEEQKLKLARQIKYILDTRHTVPVDTEYPYENDIADFILGREAALSQQHEREIAQMEEHYLINLLDHDTHPWRGPCPDDCVERVASRDLKRLQQQSNGGTHE